MCFGSNCPYESRVSGECTGSWRPGFYPEDAACERKIDVEYFDEIDEEDYEDDKE